MVIPVSLAAEVLDEVTAAALPDEVTAALNSGELGGLARSGMRSEDRTDIPPGTLV